MSANKVHGVGTLSVTSAGGSAQALAIKEPLHTRYFVTTKIASGTPLAGTTTVHCTPTQGTREQVRSGGIAINIDPTAPTSFTIDFPIESIDLTPSAWTADVVMLVSVMAED